MPDAVLFDTSAFLTLTGDEAGADEGNALLLQATAGEVVLHACFVSLTEIEYITLQKTDEATARQRMTDIRMLPILWHHSDDVLCAVAAKLKATHKISFADSFVAGLAQQLDASLLHKDPEFSGLGDAIKQRMLPPKSGPAAMA